MAQKLLKSSQEKAYKNIKGNIVIYRMLPFTFQKGPFQGLKGGILEAERRSFRLQYAAFRKF